MIGFNNSSPELINSLKAPLEELLHKLLKKHTLPIHSAHSLYEVYEYALFPTGKLFRPLLTLCAYMDLYKQHPNDNVFHAAVCMEIHHTYSLIHDDMPCMDNDDYRRGRLSVHKKFGEWQALLAGVGLLNLSYEILGSKAPWLVTWMGKMCGSNGLVHGQFLDLHSSPSSFQEIQTIHLLKTGRLIQLSLIAGMGTQPNKANFFRLIKLGFHLGLFFQFADDLQDFDSNEHSHHEQNINPFFQDYNLAKEKLEFHQKKLNELLEKYNFLHIRQLVNKLFFHG